MYTSTEDNLPKQTPPAKLLPLASVGENWKYDYEHVLNVLISRVKQEMKIGGKMRPTDHRD
jgi:hypothetical protein